MGWTPESIPDLTGRVAIVTGANAGLGSETAKCLALHNAHVIIAARSLDKGQRTVEKIKAQHPNARVDCMQLDLCSFKSIRDFVEEFKSKKLGLHILVNNAGVFMPPFSKTQEGFEVTVGTGVVGHALLTDLLLDVLKSSAPSRVVVVTGVFEDRGVLDWDDIGGEKATSSGLDAAAGGNLLKLLFAYELNKRLEGTGVTVLACHPGMAATEIMGKMDKSLMKSVFQVLGGLLTQSAAKGAYSTLYAATQPNLPGGTFYGPNMLNMGNTARREPKNPLLKEEASWKRAYDAVQDVIRAKS